MLRELASGKADMQDDEEDNQIPSGPNELGSGLWTLQGPSAL